MHPRVTCRPSAEGVLVHNGGVHSGHYYAFIRSTLSEQWYKFDDERVTKENYCTNAADWKKNSKYDRNQQV
ncbi:hypothetical protein GYH30_027774 [Glycine max]|uniref:USP domain-containing protein n=2 Tax=Glycine subgen. Soja TaxID=1462606 RepID=K7LJ00_SOYBN|nr:hypothetical protein GYH30_027774 [Glycine max]RZB86923.1 Ubiquitin carboxyl-terminal hydrolase 13 [Glycine soja]